MCSTKLRSLCVDSHLLTCTFLLFGFCVQQPVLIFSWMCMLFFEFCAALWTHTHSGEINKCSYIFTKLYAHFIMILCRNAQTVTARRVRFVHTPWHTPYWEVHFVWIWSLHMRRFHFNLNFSEGRHRIFKCNRWFENKDNCCDWKTLASDPCDLFWWNSCDLHTLQFSYWWRASQSKKTPFQFH